MSAWHSVKYSWQRKREGTVPSSISEGGKENELEGEKGHWGNRCNVGRERDMPILVTTALYQTRHNGYDDLV